VNDAARQPALGPMHAFVSGVRRAYQRLPEPARGPAVTAAFAWARAYVGSPAFAAVYAAVRQKAKPIGLPTHELSVDAEARQELDKKLAEFEESKKAALGVLSDADRPRFLAQAKELEDQFRDPQTLKFMRDEIESQRASETQGLDNAAVEWNKTYPADVHVFVRQEIERFLAASANIDFAIPVTLIRNPAGAIVGFVAPLDHPLESWEGECMMAGKDMVMAARTAIEEWVKELPR